MTCALCEAGYSLDPFTLIHHEHGFGEMGKCTGPKRKEEPVMIKAIKTQIGWFVGTIISDEYPYVLEDPAVIDVINLPMQSKLGQMQIIGTTTLTMLPFNTLTLKFEKPFAITDLTADDKLFHMYYNALADHQKAVTKERSIN